MHQPYETLSDVELIQKITSSNGGDEAACTTLYERHRPKIFSLCLKMTNGDEADAQDRTQDAFKVAFKNLHTFRGESKFSTWLHRVTVNTVLMSLRRKKLFMKSFGQLSGNDSHGEIVVEPSHGSAETLFENHNKEDVGKTEDFSDEIANRDFAEKLLAQLKTTSPGYHAVVVGKYLHDLEHGEIAARSKHSVGNSKSQNHQGLRALLILSARAMGIRINFGNARLGEIRKILKPLIARRILAH